ncbi:hypothetical protein RJ640_015012 [Escallonia rubra]|uniref:Dilute domain-containing protein n=1 Tax=Escallonia rubra TaxID=112253 RepID=A0AA88UHL6_9ASTE|nr:hypothetical protein RJ640_015012 [Escallonia rubra]
MGRGNAQGFSTIIVSEIETQIEIPNDKLFVPPETDVPSLTTSLGTRILKGWNIVLSKYARDAQVAQAEFVKSSVRTEDCPADGLLLRRECCTFSNGEYVKAGIAELELWCCQAKEEAVVIKPFKGIQRIPDGSNELKGFKKKGDSVLVPRIHVRYMVTDQRQHDEK